MGCPIIRKRNSSKRVVKVCTKKNERKVINKSDDWSICFLEVHFSFITVAKLSDTQPVRRSEMEVGRGGG
jgi:hypothetical protein